MTPECSVIRSTPTAEGADVAGQVAAVGAGVDEGLVCLRIVVDPVVYDAENPHANPVGLMGSERDGGYAEYVCAPASSVHDVTGSLLTDDQLAALPTAYGTALGMIERGRVQGDDTVLVSGASGGVGIALVQIARAREVRGSSPSAAGPKLTPCAKPAPTPLSTARETSPARSALPRRKASTSRSMSLPGSWSAKGFRCCAKAADGWSPGRSAVGNVP